MDIRALSDLLHEGEGGDKEENVLDSVDGGSKFTPASIGAPKREEKNEEKAQKTESKEIWEEEVGVYSRVLYIIDSMLCI